jgi:hypothetical protein
VVVTRDSRCQLETRMAVQELLSRVVWRFISSVLVQGPVLASTLSGTNSLPMSQGSGCAQRPRFFLTAPARGRAPDEHFPVLLMLACGDVVRFGSGGQQEHCLFVGVGRCVDWFELFDQRAHVDDGGDLGGYRAEESASRA